MRLFLIIYFAIVLAAGAQVPVASVADLQSAPLYKASMPALHSSRGELEVPPQVVVHQVTVVTTTNRLPVITTVATGYIVNVSVYRPPPYSYSIISSPIIFGTPITDVRWQYNEYQLAQYLCPTPINYKSVRAGRP